MIKLVTDSTASLPKGLVESLDIDVLSLHVHYDEQDYTESEMDLDEFYSKIADMKDNPPKSSQPSQLDFEKYFETCAIAGDEVVGVFMSSAMSGTFEGALRAARLVENKYKDFQYAIVDSQSNCFDEGFAVLSAAAAREAEADCHDVAQTAVEAVSCTRFLFAPESLSYLHAGGRIGTGAALFGNAIKLTPIFTVRDGEATVLHKVRTQKKALAYIADALKKDIEECGLNDIVVHYIGAKDGAVKWAKSVIESIVGRPVPVLPASPVIGVHVGPSMGIAYQCKKPLKGKQVKVKPELVCSARIARENTIKKLPFGSLLYGYYKRLEN